MYMKLIYVYVLQRYALYVILYTLTFRIKLQSIRFIMNLWMEIVALIKDLTSIKLTVYLKKKA